MTERTWAAVGGAALACGTAAVVAALAAGPGLASARYVSEAGAPGSPLATLYAVGFWALAAGVAALAASANRHPEVLALLFASAVGAAVSGRVTCSPGCPLPPYEQATTADLVHAAASIGGVGAAALALAALAWRTGSRAMAVGATTTIALGLTEAVLLLAAGRGTAAATVERVLLAVLVSCLVGAAISRARVRKSDRHPVAADRR